MLLEHNTARCSYMVTWLAVVIATSWAVCISAIKQPSGSSGTRQGLQHQDDSGDMLRGGPKAAWPMQEPSAEELAMFGPGIETITIVNSSDTLQAAIQRGDGHIQLQGHLDLTGRGELGSVNPGFGEVPWSVQSIQGNCTEPPTESFMEALSTGPPMLPRLPGQCVVVSDVPVLYARHGSMLLDNVYMRRRGTSWNSRALVQVWEGRWFTWQERVKLWMTHVTLQGGAESGASECSDCGMNNHNGEVYAEDCTLADFHGGKVVTVGDGDATTSFLGCKFARNHLTKDAIYDGDHAIINAMEWVDPEYTLEDDSRVLVRLQGCAFTNNTAEHILVASHGDGFNEAEFYSDRTMEVFMPDRVVPRTAHTRKLADAPERMFLSASDAWIADLRRKLPTLPRKRYTAEDDTGDDDKPGSGSEDGRNFFAHPILTFFTVLVAVLLLVWGCCWLGYESAHGAAAQRRERQVSESVGTPRYTHPEGYDDSTWS